MNKQPLPDYLQSGLALVFVGFNPGTRSGERGHHFAGPNNLFWKLLHESGLTPRLYRPEEDSTLLELGIGLTNVVGRVTPGAEDLSWAEMIQGGSLLQEKVAAYRPKVLCLLGKDVYRAYAGWKKNAALDWGQQETPVTEGIIEIVAPNPSGRSTVLYGKRLALFQDAARLAQD